ncbi:MAG: AMIN domain-containing protein [Elusimicrobia bacterium]|nr:AMIN domain-containing protein [Elusimicrobiota bacterium]
MRTVLRRLVASSLVLCLCWPQGAVFAAAGEAASAQSDSEKAKPAKKAGGPAKSDAVKQGELDELLKASKSKGAVFEGIDASKPDRLILTLSAPVKYKTQLMSDPPRLLLELIGADYQVGVKSVTAKGKYFRGVRGSQYKGAPDMISRIVVDLSEEVPWRVSPEGNNLVVEAVPPGGGPVEASAEPVKTAAAPVAKKAEPAKTAAAPAEKKAEPIKTAAAPAEKKAEPIKISAAPVEKKAEPVAASAPVEKKPEPAKAAAAAPTPGPEAASFVEKTPAKPRPKVAVRKAKPAPAVVAAAAPTLAAAPVEQVQSAPAVVARSEPVSATPPPAPVLAQSLASLAAPASPSRPGGACKSAPGADIMGRLPCHLVTLDFDNTNIRDIMALLAVKAQVNIISGPEVTGNLTLHLKDVPFDEAFRTILSMMGLTTMQTGDNILRVLPPLALAKERENASGVTKIVKIKYSKASEILTAVAAVRGAEGRKGNSLADEKTNSLILTDSAEGLVATEKLIADLDIIPRQVLIEAKLVSIRIGRNLSFGIQWDYFQVERGKALGKQGSNSIGSSIGIPTDFVNPRQQRGLDDNALTFNGIGTSGAPGATGRGTGVLLPAANAVGALTLGRVTNNWMLNATLTAAAGQGRLKLLADPKVATLNNKTAEINVQQQTPIDISNVAAGGAVSRNVTYVPIGISLKVTPIISEDGTRITMEINPTISSRGPASGSVSGAPVIETSSARTTVIVKDGETIVIGGLIRDEFETTIAKVPFFGDLPLLGAIFRNKSISRERRETIIFVTPKIIKETLTEKPTLSAAKEG